MNTSHHSGGNPDEFCKPVGAIVAADINADTIFSFLRKKWIEFPYLKAPDGSDLTWENLVMNKGKKRVTLRVPLAQSRQFDQDDWVDCEYLHYHINIWFKDLGSPWSFRYQGWKK